VLTLVVCGLAVLMLGWGWLKLYSLRRRRVELEERIEDLLTISDSLNRTEGRRAYRIAMRHATIGDVVRQIPPVEHEGEIKLQ